MEVYIALIGLAVWLLAVSVIAFLQYRLLSKLTKGVDEKDFIKVLKKILETQETNSRDIDKIRRKIAYIESEDTKHIQKVGLLRFNPFSDTGGDHSFSLAILDGNDTGFIITGLHTRERTRLYLKEVSGGKSSTELSTEEKKAFSKAQKT